jgi:hypothetical protein
MGDGKDKPKISPPPRIPATPFHPPGEGAAGGREPANRTRTIRRMAIASVMLFGLILVFVFLPRWQEQRQNRLADSGEVEEIAPSPEIPVPAAQDDPPAIVDSAVLEPGPVPTPTATPQPVPAQSGITPPRQPPPAESQFIEAMSEGLAALENRQWYAAQDAFARASRLRPDAPEVADGLARARAGQRRESVTENLRRAREFEQGEAWREAESMYSAVLAIDPESAPALDGRREAEKRATLGEKLEFHLANPGRLSTASVFDDATSCFEEALETVPSGPRLESQTARLEALLKLASTPVAVVLESDASTEVMVFRVGRLGTFTRHELNLKPGTYTVVGSRPGFRDVRLQLVVTPGPPPKPLVIRCTESL